MRIIKFIFSAKTVVLSIIVALSACSDYLDIMPDDVATMDHAFSNREISKKFLFTCYSYLPNPVSLDNNPALQGGDEMWWCSTTSGNGLNYFNKNAGYLAMGRQSANDPYLNYWDGGRNGTNLFIALRDCNIFLENIHLPTDIDEWERLQWIAEVKFLKAYYHFYLFRNYGPIPIIRENIPVNAAEEARMYRKPVDDVVNYIVELIDEAIPDLMPNPSNTRVEDAGRITQPIAAALKAEALTWAASPLLNGSEQESPTFSLIDNQEVQLFPQQYDSSKWTRAVQAIKEAIEVCQTNGHHLYSYQNVNASIAMSDITKLKCTLRGAVTEKYNPEIVWPSTYSTSCKQIAFI
ncbi:MAG: RagB/SusD family nutrient uptake outer membrane protein, partial [Candidatus Ordinivivax streblomastigis]